MIRFELKQAALASIATCCVALVARAATPPAGFVETVLVTPGQVPVPVAVEYEPGSGALFILNQGDGTNRGSARVFRRDPVSGQISTALTLTCVESTGERGLLGIAFDPDYLHPTDPQRWVYLYYTRQIDNSGACVIPGTDDGGYNRVSRFRESNGVLSGEQVLLQGPQLVANNHNGGTVRFLSDKTLLASMGDNDSDAWTVPHSRNMADLRGKMLRIARDGSVPQDNPFVGQAGVRPEIWAWGLRNPFRFSVDPETDTPYIGDVGEGTYEEIDAGLAGADYGYPCFEGPMPFRTCSPAPGPGSVTAPILYYGHNLQTPIVGSTVIGGPVYRATAFPAEYHGRYFFGDYESGWIRHAAFAPDGKLTDVGLFLTDAVGVVDMVVSPSGCLTWVGITGQGVRDVCYPGGDNTQPRASSTAAPMSGLAPLAVQFDGTASTDADQDPLSYAWNFGDGTTSAAAAPMVTYAVNGVRQAVLTVNDGSGAPNAADAAAPLRIVVGNRSPVGTITTPAPGATFSAGDTILYAGSATDPEDGTLAAAAFSWTIAFHHGGHTHPFLGPLTGVTSGSFGIPTAGEDATDVFYRIHMTVTDSGAPLGINGTVSHHSAVDILPNVTTVTVAASPAVAGLQLAIDQLFANAPWSKATVAGFPRTLTAPSSQTVNGAAWSFVSWSDGGAMEHVVTPPIAPVTFTATYQCVSGCSTSPALTVARVGPDTARLQWVGLACALSYDVVRGGLATLRSTSGDYASATSACVANDTVSTVLDDPAATPPGGLWYLVRGNGCGGVGSYDEDGTPSQTGTRTAEIAASGRACP